MGKSRAMLRAAILGHGPRIRKDHRQRFVLNKRMHEPLDGETGEYWGRLRKGLVEGARIAWVAKDYPQSREIWEEEIKARFSNATNCEVREADKILRIRGQHGRGQLEVRSMESIDGMRGFKYDGVLVDEAAHVDLRYAWRRVLRPVLADTRGWAIISSTTKIGSFFNELCAQIERKERKSEGQDRWECIHLKTTDNKLLDPEEIADLYADYPPGSTDAMEELEALLLEEHGDLFKREYFDVTYEEADLSGMTVKGHRYHFNEVVLLIDLAASLRQTADYTCGMIIGFTPKVGGQRKCGVLFVRNERLEGPGQIDMFAEMLDTWAVSETNIEAVAYQLTAVQHLRVRKPHARIQPYRVDKDKRARAVPWAAAMARGDVFWPKAAPWLDVAIKQHLKFKGEDTKNHGPHPEDHDDIVDCGSMAAVRLARVPASVGFRSVSM